jgi:CHAT domain-containing protein
MAYLLKSVLQKIAVVVTMIAGGLPSCFAAIVQPARDALPLALNVPQVRELKGGQAQSYQLALQAEQYFHVVVAQRGVDVVVTLFAPNGKKLSEMDSPNGTVGPEVVTFVTDVAGNYRLEVRALEPAAAPGKYEIKLVELRAARVNDRPLVEAHQLASAALLLEAQGRYDEALPRAQQALARREKALDATHSDVGATLRLLARLHFAKGELKAAEPLYLRLLALREKAVGNEQPEIAETLNNLGVLYHEMGEYLKAEQCYQRAFALREKMLGSEHPLLATTLSNLAALYWDKGDWRKVEPMQLRALASKEKSLGREHRDVANSLNFLAGFYRETGNYAESEKLHQRALTMREKLLGEHAETALSLFSFARLQQLQGNSAPAENLYKRALTMLEKTVGHEHPHVVQALNGLASLYAKQSKYADAEALYQRALRVQEKTLHPDAPDIARTLRNLAAIAGAKGELPAALAQLSRALDVSERNLNHNLLFGSEQQKLSYLQVFADDLNSALALHTQAAPQDARAVELAVTTLLRRKGRGLDAMADTMATLRRRANAAEQAKFNQLAELRSRLATLTLRNAEGNSSTVSRAQLTQLEAQAEKLEAELSAGSAEFRAQTQPLTLKMMQAAIPPGSALLEFARYDSAARERALGKDTGNFAIGGMKDTGGKKVWSRPRYAVYVLTAQGQPQWADLGDAEVIERAIANWRQALRDPERMDAKRLARGIHYKLMKPALALLGGAKHLLIAPDGALHLIPFAALTDERDKYLVESYALSYLTSGRDLLRLQTPRASRSEAVIVADPEFGDPPVVLAGNDPNRKGSVRLDESKMLFAPLAKTRAEARAIKELLPNSTLLAKTQATESALRQLRGPRLLHIATHGFFLQETDESMTLAARSSDDLRLGKWAARVPNPLLRSGLALAGANQGKSGDDDGVLTAMEAASLDLWGTKLVVLSACDTGVGEVRNGDGVYGLRRALVLAGAETQLMSLWPVSDASTSELMIGYYKALQQGQGRSEALRQAQLQLLQKSDRQHPFYWASFIQSGEWANLAGKR